MDQGNYLKNSGNSTTRQNTATHSEQEKNKYVAHWVRFLENFLGLHLTTDQVKTWILTLSQYPKWQLDTLMNYRLDERGGGRTLIHVCTFLDQQRPHPEREDARTDLGYKQLPAEPESKREERLLMGKEFIRHILDLSKFEGSAADRIRWEIKSLQALDKKYPHLGLWDAVKNEPRFQEEEKKETSDAEG